MWRCIMLWAERALRSGRGQGTRARLHRAVLQSSPTMPCSAKPRSGTARNGLGTRVCAARLQARSGAIQRPRCSIAAGAALHGDPVPRPWWRLSDPQHAQFAAGPGAVPGVVERVGELACPGAGVMLRFTVDTVPQRAEVVAARVAAHEGRGPDAR